MIIDAHYHIYPFNDDWKLPPAAEAEQRARLKSVRIDPERQIESVLEQMDACGVDKLGVINSWHDQSISLACPNDAFSRAVAPYRDRLFSWTGIRIRPEPDIAQLRRAIEDEGFTGLKFIPTTQWFAPDDFALMAPVYETAIELGIPSIWHFGPGPFKMASRSTFGSLEQLNEVAYRYPELKVLIAHAGDLGREDLATSLTTFPNVYIEASVVMHHMMTANMTPRYGKDASDRNKREFLWPDGEWDDDVKAAWEKTKVQHHDMLWKIASRAPKKFLFASDGPYGARMSYCVDEYKRIFAHDAELLEDIFHRNAERFFGWSAG